MDARTYGSKMNKGEAVWGVLLVIGIILLVLWLLGLFVFNLGALIHVALVIAVIFIIPLAIEKGVQTFLTIPPST